MGRLLAALSDSPTALETHGTTTNVVRVLIFCISATFASLSGALLAVLFHYSVGSNYSSFNSLILVALVVISVFGMPWYGLIAAFGYTIIPGYVTITNITVYLEIIFGFFATTYAMQRDKVPTVPRRLRERPRPVGRTPARAEPGDCRGASRPRSGRCAMADGTRSPRPPPTSPLWPSGPRGPASRSSTWRCTSAGFMPSRTSVSAHRSA